MKNTIILLFLLQYFICNNFIFAQITSDYQKHLKDIDSLHQLNAKTPQINSKKARIYMYLVDYYGDVMRYDSSLIYAQEGIKIAQTAKDYAAESRMWGLMAATTYYSGDFEQGIEWATKSLEVAESIKKDSLIFTRLNILGLLYLETTKYKDAKAYFERSLSVFDKMDKQQKSNYADVEHYKVVANLAEVYEEMRDFTKSLTLHEQSFQEAKKLNGFRSMAIARSHQAVCYQGLNQPDKAIKSLEEGLIYAEKISDKDIHNYLLCRFVDIYLKSNQIENAEKYLRQSFEIAKDSTRLSKRSEKKLYSTAATLYKQKKDFEKAFFYKEKATALDLKFYDEKASRQLEFANIKFKTKEKDLEINQKTKDFRNLIIFGSVFSLMLIAFFYFLRRRKQIADNAKKQVELRTTMIQTQENERERIAKDLHDSVGAMLATVKNQIEQLKYENTPENYDKTIKNLQATAQEVRRISHNLMPIVLLKFDLVAALENLCHSVQNPSTELVLADIQSKMPKEKEILLYRIVQEVITNAIKYAEATNIYVQITEENKKILLQIEDNGKGFDFETAKNGLGIRSMQVRTEILGGKINIDTAPKRGTIIILEIPV